MKIIAILFFLNISICSAQNQGNIWYFGDHVGLDFSSGNPVFINGSSMVAEEGSAVIADSSGNLLFYTNGVNVWNRNHQVMPNGDSLMGHVSSSQAALIIPKPGSNSLFYVFTTDGFQNNLLNGYRYSVIDMCLDNGNGDIISSEKDIPLFGMVSEKQTALRHGNGIDYWIITHEYFSDAFIAFHLSSSGISDTVISHMGSIHPISPQATGGAIGQLKGAPDASKLVIASGNGVGIAEYFDFDNWTGLVTNCVSLSTNSTWMYYGVSFSPDNSKIYVACSMNGNGIYQFDLNAGGGNPAAVIASQTLIANSGNYLALQLANNGKIYSARSPFGFNPYLGVIQNPNNAGLSCNFIDSAVYLNGLTSNYGFPNFIDSYDYHNGLIFCNETEVNEINKQIVSISPNPATDIISINTSVNSFLKLKIFNCIGQPVYKLQFINSTTININNFDPGIYTYQVMNGSQLVKTGKIMKY
jgi:hypothetical protein